MPYQKDPRARTKTKRGPIVSDNRDKSREKSGPIQRTGAPDSERKKQLEKLKARAEREEAKRDKIPSSYGEFFKLDWKSYIRIEYNVQTTLSPREVFEKLQTMVEHDKKPSWFSFQSSGKDSKRYVGMVDEETFDFIRRGRKTNDMQPATRGSYEKNDRGTLIKLQHGYENASLIQIALFFGIGLLIALVKGSLGELGLFSFIVMPVVILIMAIVFKFKLIQEQLRFVKRMNGTVEDVNQHIHTL
ncbi:MAG: ABC transporter ATP-binding protein [Flavobacteriia bacterium]|nr:ABC transporter ATP-binding protein [Flavobacteriia bacterium]